MALAVMTVNQREIDEVVLVNSILVDKSGMILTRSASLAAQTGEENSETGLHRVSGAWSLKIHLGSGTALLRRFGR